MKSIHDYAQRRNTDRIQTDTVGSVLLTNASRRKTIMLPVEATYEFLEWLRAKIEEEGISPRETALRMGFSDSYLGKILRGQPPGADAIIKIADYYDEPRERVFYLAGYLKYDPTQKIEFPSELLNLVRRIMAMPKRERQIALKKLKSILELVLTNPKE